MNEKIRAFSETWGPLGVGDRDGERIEDWRGYAALAAALLRFASKQVTGGWGSDADWSTICGFITVKELDDLTSLPAYRMRSPLWRSTSGSPRPVATESWMWSIGSCRFAPVPVIYSESSSLKLRTRWLVPTNQLCAPAANIRFVPVDRSREAPVSIVGRVERPKFHNVTPPATGGEERARKGHNLIGTGNSFVDPLPIPTRPCLWFDTP